jgi:hypothetical protein
MAGPQDFTIEDLLSDAQSTGASPMRTMEGLRQWRADMAEYGRGKHEPEEYWKRLSRLDQDLAPVLSNLREQEGVQILRSIPEEQRSFFTAQYAQAAGDPEQMAPAFKDVAAKLNGLSTAREFSLDQAGFVTLETDDGKPLADAVVRGDEALVRPLNGTGKPFLVPISRLTPEQMKEEAEQATIQASTAGDLAKTFRGGVMADPMTVAAVRDQYAQDAQDAEARAAAYGTGDPNVIAGFEISKKVKSDPKLLGEIADKSLADRVRTGLLRASINTTRAVGDMSDFLGSKPPTDLFAGFEEALATTNEDTARSFQPTQGDKVATAAAESLGQMAPTILPYGLAMRGAGAAASELAAAATMAPASYGAELGQMLATAKEAEDAGDTARATQLRSVARWSSLAQAAIDTGTEMMFGETAASMRGGKGALARIATAPVKEGLEEVTAGALERGYKQPAFYPKDMQQPIAEGMGTEFAAGAMASAPITVASEAAAYKRERKMATAAAPDPGTAAVVNEIFDAAEDMASLDLPEAPSQGVANVTTPAQAVVEAPPAPAQPVELPPTPLTTPESGAPPVAPDELPPTTTTPNEEIQREGEGLQEVAPPETNNPAAVEPAPGGVVDPGMPTEEPATGSSAPAFSNEQVPPVPEIVNPAVDIGHLRDLAASPTIGPAALQIELKAYTPEERTVIAQELGIEDISPAALAKALRYQEQGPTRFSVGEESPTSGMTEAQAREALGGAARGVTFINDPEARTPWGAPWAGKADRSTGEVVINLAHIQGTEDLIARVKEEKLHIVWNDPAVRSAVATLEASLTPAMLAEVERLGYEPGMLNEEAATRLVERLTRTPDGRSAWRKFVDAIRSALRRLFRMEPDARQVEAAARSVLQHAMATKTKAETPVARPAAAVAPQQTSSVVLNPNVPVTLTASTSKGEPVQMKMPAGEAEAMLTKRKTLLEILLDCLT